MNPILSSLTLLFLSTTLSARMPAPERRFNDSLPPTIYELRLIRMPGAGSSLNGYLGALNEQSITLLQTGANRSKPALEIPVADIDQLKFRDEKSVGRGLLYGAGIGFGLGFIVGLASGGTSPCTAGPGLCIHIPPAAAGLFAGLIAILPGTVIGGTIGSLRVKIPIKGRQTVYERQKDKLEQYRRRGNFNKN
ncbi:MAG: hypothetical protein R3D58_18465 [Saprospiraceae bacterium]